MRHALNLLFALLMVGALLLLLCSCSANEKRGTWPPIAEWTGARNIHIQNAMLL